VCVGDEIVGHAAELRGIRSVRSPFLAPGGCEHGRETGSPRPVDEMDGPRGVLANAVQGIVGRESVTRVNHMRYRDTHQTVPIASQTLPDVESRRCRGRRISRYVLSRA